MKENPLTMEMLLDQLAGLNIIQLAAIPLILLVITEILTIIQKKRLLRQFRHHISYVYRTCKCCYLRCIKNRIFELYCFFIMSFLGVSKRMVGLCSLHHCLRLFRYWSHRLTHMNRFGGQLMLHIIIQKK
jgi:hypothetical protein